MSDALGPSSSEAESPWRHDGRTWRCVLHDRRACSTCKRLSPIPLGGAAPGHVRYGATTAIEAARRRPAWRQGLYVAAPGLLLLGAIGAVILGTFMTVKTYRTDHQIAVLVQRGVPVTYHLSTCSGGNSGSTCVGSFRYHGTTYDEPIQGILNFPNDGANLAAVIDPKAPGAYVYVRSAVFGPNAAGRSSWLLGAVLLGALALGMAVFSRVLTVQRRSSNTPSG